MRARVAGLTLVLLLPLALAGDDEEKTSKYEFLPVPNGAAMRLGPPLRGHLYGVKAVAVHGETIVTAGTEGFVHFWDRKTGAHKSVLTFEAFDHVIDAKLSPDGDRLLWTAGDRIGMCRLKPLERPFVPPILGSRIDSNPRSFQFDADGRSATWCEAGGIGEILAREGSFASGASLEKTCKEEADLATLGDQRLALASGSHVTVRHETMSGGAFDPHAGRVTALWFARNEKLLATGSEDGEFALFKVNDALSAARTKVVATAVFTGGKRGDAKVESVALSRDGRVLVVADVRRVRLVDSKSGEVKVTVDVSEDLSSWALSEDSRTLVVGLKDHGVLVCDVKYDLSSASQPRSLPLETPRSVSAITPVGSDAIACADDGGTIRVWTTAGELRETIGPTPDGWQTLALSRDGSAVLRSDGSSVRLERRPSAEIAWTTPLAAALPACFSADGRQVAVFGDKCRVVVLDAGIGKEIGRTIGPGAWSGSTEVFGYVDSSAPSLEYVEADGRMRRLFREERNGLFGAAATLDGSLVATYSRDGGFGLYRDGKRETTLEVPPDTEWWGTVARMRFDDEGRRLAVGSWDGDVLVFDVAARKLAAVFRAQPHMRPTSLAFLPGTNRVAAGYRDGSVVVWDTKLLKK